MKKISKKLALGLLVPSLIAPVAVLASCNVTNDSLENNLNSNLANSNSNMKFLFNGKYYDSLDDITNELVNNNKFINSDLYYGNASEAIFDHETNRLNINKLRKYDSSRINSAYLNAFGGYEQDFMKAKRSFVNEGLVKYKYQDTQGKLHSSFSEAKRAILNGVKVDETVFYQIKDQSDNNKVYKINPLNKYDINLMKKIAINNAKWAVANPSKSSEFNIMPMIRDETGGKYNAVSFNKKTSLFNEMFSKTINTVYDNFYNTLINIYKEAIKRALKNTTFSSVVKFNYSSTEGHQLSYNIKPISQIGLTNINIDSEEMIILTPEGPTQHTKLKSLKFNKIKYDQLNYFDVFLSRDKWNKPILNPDGSNSGAIVKRSTQKYNGIFSWIQYDKSDTLNFSNFLGNSFQLYSTAYDGTGNKYDRFDGINTQILTPGTFDSAQLDFDVNFVLENQNKFIEDLEREIFRQLGDIFIANPEDKSNLNLEYKLVEDLFKKFMDEGKYNIDKLFKDTTNLQSPIESTYKYNIKNFKEIQSLVNVENNLFSKATNYINDSKVRNDIILESLFKTGYKKLNYFLSYNNVPIFSIKDEDIKNSLSSNYSQNFYSSYLNNSYFNLNILSNISNLVSENGKQIIDTKYLVKTTVNKQGYFTIPKEISEYQGKLNKNVGSTMPDLPNLYFALNSYNQNLKRLRARYSESTLAIIKDKFVVKPNDILVLRGKLPEGSSNPSLHQILTTYYGEYVSLAYDFNESTVNNNKIVYDIPALNATKIANSTIEPAKVIVVYDLSGNVINPGIVLTEDLVMQTTSDAMYDSERTILDNIYRTLIIKKSPNKIFYLNEDNKTYTLLDYQTNFIYKLEYDKKTHYFLTYQHAWLYLREIIALEAQRVNIKG